LQPVVRARRDRPHSRGLLGPYRSIFAQAGVRAVALYALVFTEGLAVFGAFSYQGALLHERDGMEYAMIGILLMLNGLAGMIAARYVGRLVLRLGEVGMLRLGGGLMALSNLAAIAQPALIFFSLAMLLGGAGFIVAHSTLQTRATELVPSMRGTAVSLFAFSLFLGGGLGAAIIGMVVLHLGYTAMLLGVAGVLVIFTLVAGPLLSVGRERAH
jgi:predicted MFS family arabinose efflux permease